MEIIKDSGSSRTRTSRPWRRDRRDGRRLRPRLRRGRPAARGGRVGSGPLLRRSTRGAEADEDAEGRRRGRRGGRQSEEPEECRPRTGYAEGSQEPDLVRQEHPQDHAGDGDGGRRAAAPRGAADRGHAPLRAGDPQDDAAGRGGVERRDRAREAAPGARADAGRSGSRWSPATAASPARSTPTSSARACACAASSRPRAPRRFSVVGRRGNSTMRFRGENLVNSYVGFTDRPAFTNAREISRDLTTPTPTRSRPRRARLQPLRLAADPVRAPPDPAAAAAGGGLRRGHPRARGASRPGACRSARARLVGLRAGARGAAHRTLRGVRRPVGLPGAARVDRVGARRG